MVVKLTYKDPAKNGAVFYVNAKKVVLWDDAPGGGTRLVIDEIFAYIAAESSDAVTALMQAALVDVFQTA